MLLVICSFKLLKKQSSLHGVKVERSANLNKSCRVHVFVVVARQGTVSECGNE